MMKIWVASRRRGLARILYGCVGLLLAGAAVGQPPDRPNVLLVVADDLNTYLGCYGDPTVQTPHLDRLAARSVRFTNAHAQYPLCGPSRNSFLTGLYPDSLGIFSNNQIFRDVLPQHVSLPQAFRRAGYLSARVGKMYHYNVPSAVGTDGCDDPASWEISVNPVGVDKLQEEPLIFRLKPDNIGSALCWLASEHADARHTDGMITHQAQRLMDLAARDERPFFLAVGYFRPHLPFVAPKPYFERYPLDELTLAAVEPRELERVPAAALMSLRKEERDLSEDHQRRARQGYLASISFIDAQVGQLLDALENQGLADDTVVVFTSDHGYHMGEHGLYQKKSLFEQATRVPLFIAAPGSSVPGSVVDQPVGLIDLYPTLAELCGLPTETGLQGQSLAPMLEDESAPGRGWALSQQHRDGDDGVFVGYSLRTFDWRYTEWDGGRRGRELYDHRADPGEHRNLIADADHAQHIQELAAQLHQAIAITRPADGAIPPAPRQHPVVTVGPE